MKKIVSTFFLLLGLLGFAQIYPVQLTPIFNSPYSSKLADYTNTFEPKFQLLVNTTDFAITNRQVRLKLIVEGNGIKAESSDFVIAPAPIYINGGELMTLTNSDLGYLFKFENLQGINPLQYSSFLPEGMYSFCFEMYDMMTNQRISRSSCAYLYLMLNDPPFLNLPAKKEQIMATDFPNIFFSWTPRNGNVTNVSYHFEIKEILDPTIDPEYGFLMSPLLYEETLYTTAFVYDLGKPALLPGKRYAWRVKAISTGGLSENAVFKNDGYSEIYWFTYATNCSAPAFVLAQLQGSKSVKITWQGNNVMHNKYHLQYRKSNVADAEWFSTYTQNEQATINDLEANQDYEYRVGASCEPPTTASSYTYSGINHFETPAQGQKTDFSCGLNPAITITNQTPIKNLLVGETFTAGDFPIKILEISGTENFSGKGYVTVPYLNDTKIAVAFENIKINTNYQLIDGVVETAYNPDWKNIADVEDLTATGDNGEVLTKEVPYQIVNITTDANGDIKVNGSNGEQIIIPGGSALTITDSSGKVYTVDSQGEASGPYVAAAGGATTPSNTAGVAAGKGNQPAQVTAITATGIKVTFEPTKNTLYAFDKCPKDAPDNIKNQYKKVGNDYLVYKAVPKGKTDYIFAKVAISDSNINKDKLVFKTITGIEIEKEPLNDGFLLTLKGIHNYVEEEVIATLKQDGKDQIAGAFKLVHLSEKTINLTLVPLNRSSSIPADAAVNLQAIYAKAGVKLNIKIAPVLPYDGGADKAITTSESGIFDYYTDEEKAINAQIKALATYDKDSYYLIYSNLPSTKGIDGFMALGGQFGYVFPNASGKTAAHELGHGVFILEHPFASESDKAKTPFLLDYGNGTELWHQDWAQINNPKLKFYGFQKDIEGELAGGYGLSPNWAFVNNGDETKVANLSSAPEGFVGGFISNNTTYKWVKDKYISDDGTKAFETEIKEPALKSKIYLFYNSSEVCGRNNYLRTSYTEELQRIIKARDNKKLIAFIKTFANDKTLERKLKDEKRDTYWGYVACNGTENKNPVTNCPDLPKEMSSLTVDYLIDHFFASKNASCLITIPLEKRKELLKKMLKNWILTSCLESESYPDARIGNCYEPLTYKLILSTPKNDEKILFDWFISEKLIFPLLDKTQFKTFDDITKKLLSWQLEYYPLEDKTAIVLTLENKLKRIEFKENYVKGSITNEGFVLTREAYGQCKECVPVLEQSIVITNPLEYVLVHFTTEIMGFKAGSTVKMPALAALYLFNKDRRELIVSGSKTIFDIALLAVGVGELQAAYKAYQGTRTIYATYVAVKALGDVGMSITDIVINDALAQQWAQTPEGQKRLERWNTINTYYAIGTITASSVDMVIQKINSRTIKNAEEFDKFANELEIRAGLQGSGSAFKVGDNLVGITIKQIKQGTNSKYAIIGRSMGNAEITGVRNAYSELKNIQKVDVEIFDASSLTGIWKTKFDDALTEFAQKTNNWTTKLTNQELLQLKIYKVNKEWAQHLVDDGYTILDMGDFNNLGFSAFYSMEKLTIFK